MRNKDKCKHAQTDVAEISDNLLTITTRILNTLEASRQSKENEARSPDKETKKVTLKPDVYSAAKKKSACARIYI